MDYKRPNYLLIALGRRGRGDPDADRARFSVFCRGGRAGPRRSRKPRRNASGNPRNEQGTTGQWTPASCARAAARASARTLWTEAHDAQDREDLLYPRVIAQ